MGDAAFRGTYAVLVAGPFATIETVLGNRLAEVDEQSIARLVSNRVREASNLDFKESLYGRSDSDKRELATDISAMANADGGVILLGIRDEDGAAVDLSPIELSEEEEQRIRLVVASNVAPSPAFDIHRVESSAPNGFYLLAIPSSPWKPHAVIVNKALRYPRRFGPDTVYLSESEVADAYRNRFRLAEQQIARSRLIQAEALPFVELRDEAWLAISVVPNAAGHLALSARTPKDLMEWVVSHPTPQLGFASMQGASFTYGSRLRRVFLSRTPDPQTGRARYGYYEFHTDGAATGLVPIASSADNAGYRIFDEDLVQEVVALVRLLADFAIEKAHCVGEAVLTAEIIEADRGKHPPSHSLRLCHARRGAAAAWPQSHAVFTLPPSEHTVDLTGVSTSIVDLLLVGRLVLTDFFQSFGLPEVPQIDEQARLRKRYFAATKHPQLEEWASTHGVDIVDSQLPQ